MRILTFVLSVLLLASCNGGKTAGNSNNAAASAKTNSNSSSVAAAPLYSYDVVKSYPHDGTAFTQGLVFLNGVFYESTGEYGDSSVRKVEVETGKILNKKNLAEDYFAEGLTVLNDKVYQITWREFRAFQYDLNFNLIKEFRYQGEGWGLTNDGKQLIMSDGTHVIRFIDPETFETVRTIAVNDEKGRPLMRLNELEYVKGEIWANIWHSEEMGKPNTIARINPADGKLLGWIDLAGISPDDVKADSENVLNGIAYDAATDRLFVTGKNWKKLFEIKIKPKA